jgi:hypothetical protein
MTGSSAADGEDVWDDVGVPAPNRGAAFAAGRLFRAFHSGVEQVSAKST